MHGNLAKSKSRDGEDVTRPRTRPLHGSGHQNKKKTEEGGSSHPADLLQRALSNPQQLQSGDRSQLQSMLGPDKSNEVLGEQKQTKKSVNSLESDYGGDRQYQVLSSNDPSEKEAKSIAHSLFSQDQGQGTSSVQRKGKGSKGFTVNGEISRKIDGQRGKGQPLEPVVRQEMEDKIGGNFKNVRIHQGRESNQINRAVNANALTSKRDVFFRDGALDTKSKEGKTRLAEELIHVKQQSGDSVQRQTGNGDVAPVTQSLSGGGSGGVIQRDGNEDDVQENNDNQQPQPQQQNQNQQPQPQQQVDYNAIATADPEDFIKRYANHKWENVVQMYKDGLLHYDPTLLENNPDPDGIVNRQVAEQAGAGMNALLSFRLENTLLKNRVGQYSGRKSLMQETHDILNRENRQNKVEFGWNYGAGTSSPTSDIDSNLSGEGTAHAMRLFYKKFREYWNNHESGVIFDVNVYIRDYLPVGGGGTLWKANLGHNQGKHNKKYFLGHRMQNKSYDYETEDDNHDTVTEHTDVRFETMFQQGSNAYRLAMKDEEVYALVKTRMDMNDQDWRDYVHINLPKGTSQKATRRRARLNQLFNKVSFIYNKREKEIKDTITAFDENDKLLSDGEQRMKAENKLYEASTRKIDTIRKRLKAMRNDPKVPMSAVERLQLHLVRALHQASVFANEAYVTGAAVVHVVANKQILSNKSQMPITDPRMPIMNPNGPSNMKVKLSIDQFMHSFDEQLGFVFKEINLYKPDVNKSLIKSAKYIHRMGNAAKHIYKLAGKRSGSIEGFLEYGKKLLALKLGDKPYNLQESWVKERHGSQELDSNTNNPMDITPIKYHFDWTNDQDFNYSSNNDHRQTIEDNSDKMIAHVKKEFLKFAAKIRRVYDNANH